MLTVAQSVVRRGGRVSAATLHHTSERSHTQAGQSLGPLGTQGSGQSHSGREVIERHTGTGMVSGGHTGSGSVVSHPGCHQAGGVSEFTPFTVSLAAQRRESAVKEMQPESARPKPLSTRR